MGHYMKIIILSTRQTEPLSISISVRSVCLLSVFAEAWNADTEMPKVKVCSGTRRNCLRRNNLMSSCRFYFHHNHIFCIDSFFILFRELRCLRNTIHTHLMITYVLADTLWIITSSTTITSSGTITSTLGSGANSGGAGGGMSGFESSSGNYMEGDDDNQVNATIHF